MNKIFKLTAILLSIVLIVGIAGCGGKSKTKASKSKSVIQEASAQESNPVIPVLTAQAVASEFEDIPVNLRVLPTNEFGREDPFVPLAGAVVKTATVDLRMQKARINDENSVSTPMARATVKKVEVPAPPTLPSVRLSLAIDGSTAIFDDNRTSKVASVGDTVSGMKVLEIRGNEAVLGNGSKKYIVSQGGIREDASAPVPVPVQNNNTPKVTKIKKK